MEVPHAQAQLCGSLAWVPMVLALYFHVPMPRRVMVDWRSTCKVLRMWLKSVYKLKVKWRQMFLLLFGPGPSSIVAYFLNHPMQVANAYTGSFDAFRQILQHDTWLSWPVTSQLGQRRVQHRTALLECKRFWRLKTEKFENSNHVQWLQCFMVLLLCFLGGCCWIVP